MLHQALLSCKAGKGQLANPERSPQALVSQHESAVGTHSAAMRPFRRFRPDFTSCTMSKRFDKISGQKFTPRADADADGESESQETRPARLESLMSPAFVLYRCVRSLY